MKAFHAVLGGSTNHIGYVDAGVLHGFAVPVDEEFFLGFRTLQTVHVLRFLDFNNFLFSSSNVAGFCM